MFDDFFSLDGRAFIPFGTSHVVMLIIYGVGLVLLIFFSTSKKRSFYPKTYNLVRWFLFFWLVTSEVSYQAWTIATGIWSLSEHIPLHLCGIASITVALALLLQNKLLGYLSFYIGFIPPLLALITPELPYDYSHFRYWKFFVHHIVISWASLFVILTSSSTLTYLSVLRSFGILLIYAAFIGFFVNPVINANYLFLRETPLANTPLDYFGTGVLYYVNLCLVALIVFSVQWAAIHFLKKRQEFAKPLRRIG